VKSVSLLCFACIACAPAATPGQEQDATGILRLYDLEGPTASFEMPGRLDEISGLAITADGRLFGHNDERATVHEIDPTTGEVGKRVFVGADPSVEGDFEGLAIVGERFFLVTSEGILFEFREVGDREIAQHRTTDTGLGGSCEVEGLDYDPREEVLLLACKTTTPERPTILIHRLPLDPQRARPDPISVPRAGLGAFGIDADFQASSVALSPAGTLFLSSPAPEALIEVDRTGRLLAGVELPPDRHPQPEGLAFGPDGTLYLSDEQNGASARVTVYSRARNESVR
jgi:uncharacterized protein YjiK